MLIFQSNLIYQVKTNAELHRDINYIFYFPLSSHFLFSIAYLHFTPTFTTDLNTHCHRSSWQGPGQCRLGWCLCNSCIHSGHCRSVANPPWWVEKKIVVIIYLNIHYKQYICDKKIFLCRDSLWGFFRSRKTLKKTKKSKLITEKWLEMWSDRKSSLMIFTFGCSDGGVKLVSVFFPAHPRKNSKVDDQDQ